MPDVDIEEYLAEKECTYKEERYSVRDNGAILRRPRPGKKARPNDGKWTFGKANSSNPYLHISGVQVHRIVATAFHGEPNEPGYVVDHIDTNCRNNRPENLRWLTRLENVLKNPVTRRKVEYLCGSIEAFLDNPSLLRETSGNPNFDWMRAVTPEEAANCKARMEVWASSPSAKRDAGDVQARQPADLTRMHQPLQRWEAGLDGEPGLDFALTPRSAQYMWSREIHFPCCPTSIGQDPLVDYARNARDGAVFAYSDDKDVCPEMTVHRVEHLRTRGAILVLCKRAEEGWAVVGIELSRTRLTHFIHFYLGSYAGEAEANDAFARKADIDFWSDAYTHAWEEQKRGGRPL